MKYKSTQPSKISTSKLSIYDSIEIGSELWIPSDELQTILSHSLLGLSLRGYPLRTRSKFVKSRICEALGYPTPTTFIKTHPRFPGQLFDTYIQKSNNLQIWNEEISPSRRYVIIRLSADDIVTMVRVITGDMLSKYSTTGTLTQKYQASVIPGKEEAELVVPSDTENLRLIKLLPTSNLGIVSPTEHPSEKNLMTINEIFLRLKTLLGKKIINPGKDQERNRGGELHKLACQTLGYKSYLDNGQFPDILNQLLEIKLQSSPTIDLGLIKPDNTDPLDIPKIQGIQIRHCDVRYAVFYAKEINGYLTLSNIFVTTGESFFRRFNQFGGMIVNKKYQIRIPDDFSVQ